MGAHEQAGKSDEWFTPAYIFAALGCVFDIDVAAPFGGPRHVPCYSYFTKGDDGLSKPWDGFVWMNPPYGHQRGKRNWLRKFFENGNGIALVPDRTSAPWFQEYAPKADLICFVAPKIKFERPDGSSGESPGNGTALFGAGVRAVSALRQCNLGMLVKT